MKKIYQTTVLLFSLLAGFSIQARSQTLTANNDNAQAGPFQKVRIDVTKNDVIPCDHYTLSIVNGPSPTQGIADFDGDFLVFIPGVGAIGQTITITYNIECDGLGTNAQAAVAIAVTRENLPINIIQTDEYCVDAMPENVKFGIHRKFIAYSDDNYSSSHKGGYIQVFQIPLAGDLNGDGKPEIIAAGGKTTSTLDTYIDYIYIFDGQTGNKLFKFDLSTIGSGYGHFRLGSLPYHQSPSYMAIADVDNDGIGEIIVCQSTDNGKVYALKPTLDANKKITGLAKMWDGEYGHKAPLSDDYTVYGQPIPNIVDINGDGIPELVVYNKIYNARTGKLLMAWDKDAAAAKASSLATGTGLANYNPGSTSTNNTYSNNVKAHAMVGRRPSGSSLYNDLHIAVPAIVDTDDDGEMEVITGNRIHKFNLSYLGKDGEPGNHAQNTYTTIEGPTSVTVKTNTDGKKNTTYYFNDGFTRVADLDGDGKLEAIVFQNGSGEALDLDVLVYIWDIETRTLKAAASFRSDGTHGTFGIPFVGDINNRLDGRDIAEGGFTKKLPEICVTAGGVDIDGSSETTGIPLHPAANMPEAGSSYPKTRFNNRTDKAGHIIALTYDGGESDIQKRLKISWALEHYDYSDNTGISMFDFNNDGAFDLCYRDEETIRVISPKLGTYDYIRNDAPASEPAILFKSSIQSNTGFETPAIADVNMDGSADIVVVGWSESNGLLFRGNVYVFEHAPGNPKWAPCPPVWNQALYNPLHINEDLTVPARPISMLSTFSKGSETIQPYNGAWIQQPIVKDGEDHSPIYRHPDAALANMKVERTSDGKASVTLTIRNDGLASISATTPVDFYITNPDTPDTKLYSQNEAIGTDVFSNEKVTLSFTINYDPAGKFTHCRLVDDGANFPATNYTDCEINNNYGYTAVITAVDDSYTVFNGDQNLYDIVANDITIGNAILTIGENPKNGTANITPEGKLSYTFTQNTERKDSLRYILRCEYEGDILATIDTAWVRFTKSDLPDNIITNPGACVAITPRITFGIAQKWEITDANDGKSAHQKSSPMAGDLDGDGIPEIVVAGKTGAYSDFKNINVFDGASRELKASLTFEVTNGDWASPVPFALVDADANGWGEIVYVLEDKAYSYEAARDNDNKLQFNLKWGPVGYDRKTGTTFPYLPQPLVADFNGDGKAEIVVNNCIFDGTTGALLGRTEPIANAFVARNPATDTSEATFAGLGDFDNDEHPELVLGAAIYKINVDKAGTDQFCQILSKNTAIGDGFAAVADLDLDGRPEVVVAHTKNESSVTRAYLYTWRPDIENNGAGTYERYHIPNGAGGTSGHISFPLVGDIDGKEENGKYYPEICVSTINSVRAFRYNPGLNKHEQKWFLQTSDDSGGTGITLFDFDNDGASELVYRDMTDLRIIDGRPDRDLTASDNLASTPCKSGTASEYPIIADIDGSGSASILVTCYKGSSEGGANTLMAYESGTQPWTPARGVWHQAAYDPSQINEDLTVPAYPLAKQTSFIADGRNHYPYNGTLTQVPITDINMKPILEAPDPYVISIIAEQADATTTYVKVTIGNQGVKNVNANLPVTLYKDSESTADILGIKTIDATLQPGNTVAITYDVPTASITSTLIARLQDDGNTYPAPGSFRDCNTDNNTLSVATLLAINDQAATKPGVPVTVDVLANDILGGCTIANIISTVEAQSVDGTAVVENGKIKFTPGASFNGNAIFTYKISCGDTQYSIGSVRITLIKQLPDNIITDDGDCVVPFEEIVFDVKRKWYSPNGTAHSNTGPLVGDLDDDGIPEIITFSSAMTTLNVLNGSDGSVKTSIAAIPYAGGAGGWHPVMTAVLVDSDNNGRGEIILATSDLKLNSYEAKATDGAFSLEKKWGPVDFQNPTAADKLPQPIVADFNGDGAPEVVIYNQIFNAATGAKLGETEALGTEAAPIAYVGRIINGRTGNKASNFMTAADFDDDDLPEIVAGGKVYKVNISPDGATAACGILYQASAFNDGFTAVADVDLDGKLDVVVVDCDGSQTRINVWSPTDGLTNAGRMIDQITIDKSDVCQGYPFIGDIDGADAFDGEKYPEICVVTREVSSPTYGRVSAYKYNPSAKKYELKWKLLNSDTSGGTGITLFDFNNDGINEIVYRDEKELYIYNGIANTTPVLASPDAHFTCTSGTAFEYPVIADLDGSGSAKICVACAANGVIDTPYTLNAFESNTTPWAPTRKVWNQVNYEPTMINENLTVPKTAFPKHAVFEAERNSVMEEFRPYNGALIQVPVTNEDMKPVVRAADAYVAGIVIEQHNATTVNVKVIVGNRGRMNASSSLPVTLYTEHTNTDNPTNAIGTQPIGVALLPGAAVTLTYNAPIAGLRERLIARVQDDGQGSYPVVGYSDCDHTNNIGSAATFIAIDDFASPYKNSHVDIDVPANDGLGQCNETTIVFTNISAPSNGEAQPAGKKIRYTPTSGFVGSDSFTYTIRCAATNQESTATVSIVVNSLLMVEKLNDKDASEPNADGIFRIKFTDTPFTLTKDLEVTYTITPTAAIEGVDYQAVAGTAIIEAGKPHVDVIIEPIDNFMVEGNNKQVQLLITGAAILGTP